VAAISKDRLREQLEASMEDVAMLMSETVNFQERLREIRAATAEVWKMADLGDVPEWETQVRAVKVS
jgi:hypothetical protein